MRRDGRKHRSPNAGWPEAAMAGALGVALAGPRHYAEAVVNDPWLGGGLADGTPRAEPADIARALRLYTLACLLLAGLVLGAWLAAHIRPLG
jgi:adenosylcobinamide-phosphate synthase